MTHLAEQTGRQTSACDELVVELLERARLYVPPVDALAVAEALDFMVIFDAAQAGRARTKRCAGNQVICLKPDDRPERQQWAVAHEIGEALLHRLAGGQEWTSETHGRAAPREQAANEFAARLLLPSDWFLTDAARLDGDLFELKARYRTASHELILTNLLRLPALSLVTVFDHGRVTRRKGNGQLPPPPLLPLERRVVEHVHRTGRPWKQFADGLRVQGWAVHEPGWPRELLRTTALEDLD